MVVPAFLDGKPPTGKLATVEPKQDIISRKGMSTGRYIMDPREDVLSVFVTNFKNNTSEGVCTGIKLADGEETEAAVITIEDNPNNLRMKTTLEKMDYRSLDPTILEKKIAARVNGDLLEINRQVIVRL